MAYLVIRVWEKVTKLLKCRPVSGMKFMGFLKTYQAGATL